MSSKHSDEMEEDGDSFSEEIFAEISRNFARDMNYCKAKAAEKEEENIIKECVNDFLGKLLANATDKILSEGKKSQPRKEEKQRWVIKPIPKLFQTVRPKSSDCKISSNMNPPNPERSRVKSVKGKKTSMKNLNLHPSLSVVDIETLVEKKIKSIIPSIVKKVAK